MAHRLANATSAYLRQHADNPVDWWPWGDAALAEARRRDVPIFVSIGYAACHWCHVMAHESFDDPAIAHLLNDSFVAIKVDREERPDVDQLYMSATQLMNGHGGWPMSVFLLPDARPFFAGTYFPPRDRGGLPGFGRLLEHVRDAWRDQRATVTSQADELSRAVERDVRVVDHLAPASRELVGAQVRARLRRELVADVDEDGGFSRAPKFPRATYVDALLDVDATPDERAAAQRTLGAMARRGLYDHIGGGFARYSVDGSWSVPHFEKMLSDQALLIRTYARAAQILEEPVWRDVALDVAAFVRRDLDTGAGFASSLDADAGGVEGAHVTWTLAEFDAALPPSLPVPLRERARRRWSVSREANFEGRTIPTLADDAPWATSDDLISVREHLLDARRRRPQPGRDDKIVLEWNAMLAAAFLTLGEPVWIQRARDLLDNLTRTHWRDDTWWRTAMGNAVATAADLAWLIDASIDAYTASGDDRELERATRVASYLVAHHWDGPRPSADQPEVGQGFFSDADLVRDLPWRAKDLFDGATPSVHAITTRALARLARVSGDEQWAHVARRNVQLAASLLLEQPRAVADLVNALGELDEGVEIVIPGAPGELADSVRSILVPYSLLITGTGANPLLRGRDVGRAYVCRHGACALPVTTPAALAAQLAEVRRGAL